MATLLSFIVNFECVSFVISSIKQQKEPESSLSSLDSDGCCEFVVSVLIVGGFVKNSHQDGSSTNELIMFWTSV